LVEKPPKTYMRWWFGSYAVADPGESGTSGAAAIDRHTPSVRAEFKVNAQVSPSG